MDSSLAFPTIERAVREALVDHPNVAALVLFGSRARGSERPDSDVDLAFIGSDVDVLSLTSDVASRLDVPCDLVAFENAPLPLLASIVRDARTVAISDPARFARAWSRALTELETDLPSYRRMAERYLEAVSTRGV